MYYQHFSFRLFPTESQQNKLAKTFGACRYIYNWARDLRYNSERYLSIKFLFVKLKEEIDANNWLKDTCGDSVRVSLATLENAYKKYYNHVSGYPAHKSRKNKQHFSVSPRYFSFDPSNHKVILDKIGAVDVEKRFSIPQGAKIHGVIVQKSLTEKYFVVICCKFKNDLPKVSQIEKSTALGLDMGISSLVITSDGRKFENREFLKHSLDKLAILANKKSTKTPGSARYNEIQKKMFLIQEKVKNQRKDYYQKIIHELTTNPNVKTICVETLSIKKMMYDEINLKRQFKDAAFGIFLQMLKNKCEMKGINYIAIDKYFKSSQTCNHCGYVNSKLTLKDREWECPSCGAKLDRDVNAACNIRDYGICK